MALGTPTDSSGPFSIANPVLRVKSSGISAKTLIDVFFIVFFISLFLLEQTFSVVRFRNSAN
jgi:hypothetical protein